MDIVSLSVQELSVALQNKALSSVEVTTAYLDQIQKDASHTQPLNAYISVQAETSLEYARLADARLSQGNTTALTGIPIGIKDNMHLIAYPTTCASKILTDYYPHANATVTDRLLTTEGMVPLGKTNLDEFAMGASSENSSYGSIRNPIQRDYSPGGSSGGSAAAVAGKLAPIALGSDTGGSIRQPASFTGLVGFKPTYGTVSRCGLVAFASSLDQIGPLARCVPDAALLYAAISGHDPKDSTSRPLPAVHTQLDDLDMRAVRIGFATEYLSAGLDPEIRAAWQRMIDAMSNLGAQIHEVHLPNTANGLHVYNILATSEASANLARFDGVRYGHRHAHAASLDELYALSRSEGFGAEVKRRILAGTFALSQGKQHAAYDQALKVRSIITMEMQRAFEKVDFLFGPTTPNTAFRLGEFNADPVAMYLSDIYTIPSNLAGLPSVSIPAGFSAQGMPIGMQITGPELSDAQVLQLATMLEKLQTHAST